MSLSQWSSCCEPVSWHQASTDLGRGLLGGYPARPACSAFALSLHCLPSVAWCSLSAVGSSCHTLHSVASLPQPLFIPFSFFLFPLLPVPPHPPPAFTGSVIQVIGEDFSEVNAQKVQLLMSFKEAKTQDMMPLKWTVCLCGFGSCMFLM